MQTFLPYKDFDKVATVLDNKRLNKQILECYQILKVLSNDDPHAGWRNHPAVKMWRGHEHGLFDYALAMIREAKRRGIKTDKNEENLTVLRVAKIARWGNGLPEWFANKPIMRRVKATHKANLYIKDPIAYYDFSEAVQDENNQPCCERCNYYWVTHVA
jgi:hypothetical protein